MIARGPVRTRRARDNSLITRATQLTRVWGKPELIRVELEAPVACTAAKRFARRGASAPISRISAAVLRSRLYRVGMDECPSPRFGAHRYHGTIETSDPPLRQAARRRR